MTDMSEYRELFITEMRANLDNLEDSLLSLKEKGADAETVNETFRIIHTLKGMAATMGYNITSDVAHKMEDLMSRIRGGDLRDGDIELLLEGSDLLNELFDGIIKTGRDTSTDTGTFMRRYERRLPARYPPSAVKENKGVEKKKENKDKNEGETGHTPDENNPTSTENEARATYKLKIQISQDSLMKDARAIMLLERLKKKCVIRSVTPSSDGIEAEDFDGKLTIVLETQLGREELKKEVLSIREISSIQIGDGDAPETGKSGSAGAKTGNDFQTIRVPVSRIEELQSLVEELVVLKGRLNTAVSYVKSTHLRDISSRMETVISELTDLSTELRLVPASYMFRRFQRIVRKIAKEQGKEVEFTVTGDNIEMDRPVLEIVGEAIIHLIKNSIDHGIEPPEERRKQGKKPTARLCLCASREQGYSVFVVEDDGKGIDLEKVTEVAIKKGLISQQKAEMLSKEEKINLIFLPGFSTSEKVTSISGRGVGMDVVMHTLEKIGGSIELETEPGSGTRITLKLPFTTAIIEAIVVRIGRNIYAVPLQSVVSILSIEDARRGGMLASIAGKNVVTYKGEFYPVIDTNPYLRPEKSSEHLPDRGYLLLIQYGRNLFSLPVDNIIAKEDIVTKQVDTLLDSFQTFSTATMMSDGSVAFVIDFSVLVKWGGVSA